nr:DUF3667 domain-containing protein [Chryseolinea lacunae]
MHVEKGFFFTVKELLIRPGKIVREFISENRSRLVKPIIFIVVTSLIYSIVTHFFHIEDGYIKLSNAHIPENSPSVAIARWITTHYGYANIILGVFIAFWLNLFFKKYGYNIFEIVILLCFVMGVGMLFFSFFGIVEGLIKTHLMQVSAALFFLYAMWAIAQFFDEKKALSYGKALGAYTLGMITFSLATWLLGLLADAIFMH